MLMRGIFFQAGMPPARTLTRNGSIAILTVVVAQALIFVPWHSLPWSSGGIGCLIFLFSIVALLMGSERAMGAKSWRETLCRLGFLGSPLRGELVAVVLFFPAFFCTYIFGVRTILSFSNFFGAVELNPWLFVDTVIVGGVAEEALFRGFLFRMVLLDDRRRFWRAAILTSILFGAEHGIFSHLDWPVVLHVADASMFGVIQCVLFHYSKNNLWLPICVHMFTNCAATLTALTDFSGTPLPIFSIYTVCLGVTTWIAFRSGLWRRLLGGERPRAEAVMAGEG